MLVASLGCEAANRRTLELVADCGPVQPDLDPLFAALAPDPSDLFDGVRDENNFPLSSQPKRVIEDLKTIAALAPAIAASKD